MGIKFGCHGYTWQMSYEQHKDELPHILSVIEEGGFKGLDTQVAMLGRFYDHPLKLKEEMQHRNLELAALTLSLSWRETEETDEERRLADYFIGYLANFPNALLNVVPTPGRNRDGLAERQRNIINCVNSLAKRAQDHGIVCSFHPNSPPGSVFRTKEDYELLFDGLDTRVIGYTPDAGHIACGGMDAAEIIETYSSLIKHVHFKDASADDVWKAMGEGVIDFPRIVRHLRDTGYNGWIMVEEESEKAVADPDGAMMENSKYVKEQLIPIVQQGAIGN
ncbi:sugar phosphate isomerase/epimerase [Paenibacillus sp. sptzw28]|uniref:sugar phosphate isomerase/epimerase family protein n=1 Tax=Paenibacillus sp. sptzw28 TaxID=715179 RepID=UPI001C6EB6F6|nr:sugar phosphate isomerase/epimerase [Paenibacillus sp. sptzw28]QYR21791.1 sugar phosphate isomerase/epimerase [Paenibacillus sp. sptzw28]